MINDYDDCDEIDDCDYDDCDDNGDCDDEKED